MSLIPARSACPRPNSSPPCRFTPAWFANCSRAAQNKKKLKDNSGMDKKTPVGVLGATGMVGQHFVKFLQNHPWFELKWLGASDRSAGKPYHAATAWRLSGAMPDSIAGLLVEECKPGNAPRLLFSAMDASVA